MTDEASKVMAGLIEGFYLAGDVVKVRLPKDCKAGEIIKIRLPK